jgi:hypothetical protein
VEQSATLCPHSPLGWHENPDAVSQFKNAEGQRNA